MSALAFREPDTVNAKWAQREINKLRRLLSDACDALRDEQAANMSRDDRSPIIVAHGRVLVRCRKALGLPLRWWES